MEEPLGQENERKRCAERKRPQSSIIKTFLQPGAPLCLNEAHRGKFKARLDREKPEPTNIALPSLVAEQWSERNG